MTGAADTPAPLAPAIAPVRKTVTVRATIDRAFRVFTDGMDSWWPRTHHIGKSPMTKTIIEAATGGRCYSEQEDGSECDWGTVVSWEPPHRLLIAWQVTHEWGYQPDVAQASEVDIRFTELPGGSTRVDLEHRHLERHGAGAAAMRMTIDSTGGWGMLLDRFAERAAE
jgi:uncharacterized protein YndB with AHSA1/START domain